MLWVAIGIGGGVVIVLLCLILIFWRCRWNKSSIDEVREQLLPSGALKSYEVVDKGDGSFKISAKVSVDGNKHLKKVILGYKLGRCYLRSDEDSQREDLWPDTPRDGRASVSVVCLIENTSAIQFFKAQLFLPTSQATRGYAPLNSVWQPYLSLLSASNKVIHHWSFQDLHTLGFVSSNVITGVFTDDYFVSPHKMANCDQSHSLNGPDPDSPTCRAIDI